MKTICSSCLQGENEVEVEDPNHVYTVRDPENGRIIIRGYLCDDHHAMYMDDVYVVKGKLVQRRKGRE